MSLKPACLFVCVSVGYCAGFIGDVQVVAENNKQLNVYI